MQFPTTPVKRPSVSKTVVVAGDSVVMRPAGGVGARRISAPIRDVPSESIAPDQVVDAPRAWRSRRLSPELDAFIMSPPTVVAAAAAAPTKDKEKKKTVETPRRRSTQLVSQPKTPKTPVRPAMLKRAKSFGSLAPLRPHRVETRKVLRDITTVRRPVLPF
ncbi:hypothetical protein L5515_001098 [Caenorhabditis briggsae]|uniref:Uncharacterized protein n=1 Tax=Caenorhabditis briggsae TaxID=6238 RepID=A0AAE9E1J4_CAEBR|nr:hypothetical protein L5515_001098 [Caenorhabditis briggsae]